MMTKQCWKTTKKIVINDSVDNEKYKDNVDNENDKDNVDNES